MDLKTYINKLGIPGAISSLSLLAAWLAIALLLNGNLKYSIACAALAFLFDSLDGYAARKLKKTSEIGRQLDSMIDLVGYSLYAALLVQQIVLPGILGTIVGYLIILFGVLRLIRFNTDGYSESGGVRYYRGIVTCHLSLAVIGFLLLSTQIEIPPLFIAIVLVLLSVLQLSNIKTRKTNMLLFWYVIVAIMVIGAFAWLP